MNFFGSSHVFVLATALSLLLVEGFPRNEPRIASTDPDAVAQLKRVASVSLPKKAHRVHELLSRFKETPDVTDLLQETARESSISAATNNGTLSSQKYTVFFFTEWNELLEALQDLQNDLLTSHGKPIEKPAIPTAPTKRPTIPTENPTTPGEEALPEHVTIMLKAHIHLRRKTGAANMYKLTWNPELARMAQVWSERCVFAHGHPKGNSGYKYIGQNLYMGSGTFDPKAAIQDWYDEIKQYNFVSNGCSGVCGHYTQVVWAKTKELGCGYHKCSNLYSSYGGATLFTCNYGPGGNYVGEFPYKTGVACSKCDAGDSCANGLCVHN